MLNVCTLCLLVLLGVALLFRLLLIVVWRDDCGFLNGWVLVSLLWWVVLMLCWLDLCSVCAGCMWVRAFSWRWFGFILLVWGVW